MPAPPDRTSSSTAQPTTSPSGSLPPEAVAAQGGKYYGVFLAVAPDARDGRLGDAQARAHELGYQGGVGDLGCTPGARAQLHLAAVEHTAFSVLFATKEQAAQFASAYGRGGSGPRTWRPAAWTERRSNLTGGAQVAPTCEPDG